MRVELDISLENPAETIDLTLLKKALLNNKIYKVLQHKPSNYLLILNIHNDYKIRVHEDGRIYIKTDIHLKNEIFINDILKNLHANLKKFLDSINFFSQFVIKNEINFSFYGSAAHSFFWKKYNELNLIGKEFFINYNLRTCTYTDDSIYVKLESSNPTHPTKTFHSHTANPTPIHAMPT